MKTTNLFCIIFTALFFAVIYPATSAPGDISPDGKVETASDGLKLSVETLGIMRSVNISDGEEYGVGLGVGLKLNKSVGIIGRAVAYESPDSWRGGAIDEGSLLVEANLLSSDNKRLTLSGVAGGDYDVRTRDFGISVGPRISIVLTKNLSIIAESRIRAWFNETEKDITTAAGLRLSF